MLAKHVPTTLKTPTGWQLQMVPAMEVSLKFNLNLNADPIVNVKLVKDVWMEYVLTNVLQSPVLHLQLVLMVNALFQLHQYLNAESMVNVKLDKVVLMEFV